MEQLKSLQRQVLPVNRSTRFLRDGPTCLTRCRTERCSGLSIPRPVARTTEDSYTIRRAALDYHIPYTTTITGASSMAQAVAALGQPGDFSEDCAGICKGH